jgi:hypothetical protein
MSALCENDHAAKTCLNFFNKSPWSVPVGGLFPGWLRKISDYEDETEDEKEAVS